MRFIGSKIQLLPEIEKLINRKKLYKCESFCDIFSGSASVARYFKPSFKVISNDFLYFSYVLQRATIQNNNKPDFSKVEDYIGQKIFNYMNTIHDQKIYKMYDHKDLFIYNNFSPVGNRPYLSERNALKIDLWRLELEKWKTMKLVNDDTYYYLLACIIETVPFYSNISGTYGAFLKSWDKRALKDAQLVTLNVDSNNRDNESYNEDSNKLITSISGDILYIDPPYNERQYLPNYHLLETIAKYDYPEIKGVTGIRNYDNQKSAYSRKKEVLEAFEKLIRSADFKHIIFSYNTDGIMKESDIINILKKYSVHSNVEVTRIPFKRFKSRKSVNNSNLEELLFYIKRHKDKTNYVQQGLIADTKDKNNYIKSPLNYIGAKSKILNQIVKIFPNKIDTFVDLFAGGLNVAINVSTNKVIANDINKYVISMYEYFKDNDKNEILEEVHDIINKYDLSKINKDGYLKLRKDYNLNKDPIKLFGLTCYSFNHQIRFNNSFEFNNPFGKNRSSYNNNTEKNLIKFLDVLQNRDFEFYSKDFSFVKDLNLTSDSLVYCDPPYLITNGSYNDGTRGFGDWTKEKEYELLQTLDYLNSNNIKFALSNVTMHKGIENEMLINWAEKYNVHLIKHTYNNSNYQSKAKHFETKEVLITNY